MWSWSRAPTWKKSEGQIIGGLEHPAVAVVLMDNGRGQQMGQGWMAHRKVSPKLFGVDWSLGRPFMTGGGPSGGCCEGDRQRQAPWLPKACERMRC